MTGKLPPGQALGDRTRLVFAGSSGIGQMLCSSCHTRRSLWIHLPNGGPLLLV